MRPSAFPQPLPGVRALLPALLPALVLSTACATRTPRLEPERTPASPALPMGFADSIRTERVAPRALLHTLVNTAAPWRAYVVELDLTCGGVQAVKGSATAVGRSTTSRLLADLPADTRAFAAVNADFFLFAPPGVPTNLHVEQGVLLAGPGPKPVVALSLGGRLMLDSIVARGAIVRGRDTLVALDAWNRPAPRSRGVVDARWAVPLDTIVRRQVWRLVPHGRSAVAAEGRRQGTYVVHHGEPRDTLAHGDTLLLHLSPRSGATGALRAGDTVQLHLQLQTAAGAPVALREAVGGRPIVLADSAITRDAGTEGNEGFRNLNPRTAVGLDRRGHRAWFAVIDGRQPGYSMGMTLRQVGELMQALGATQALNLDGGGSSALALRDLATGTVRVVNRPSDKTERPVGNALALRSTCGSR